ncbi:MAG TPA: hypothetical protein VMU99_03655 [Acidimicrobiales bacterium]|nr:hypothetical protein [Acidimicrobiales bacterium]
MALLVALHRVNDYDAWQKVYDEAEPLEKSGGATEKSVHRAKDDPNNVMVLHRFNTMGEAQAFMDNAEVHAAMQRAGVAGPPRVEFFEETLRPFVKTL